MLTVATCSFSFHAFADSIRGPNANKDVQKLAIKVFFIFADQGTLLIRHHFSAACQSNNGVTNMLRAAYTATMLMTIASVAVAETKPPPAPPAASTADLQQQLTANLKQSGFTDIKIVPDSFLVQAKDKSGNLITMWLNPESFTEVVAVDENEKSQRGSAGEFVNIPSADELGSKPMGLGVYNGDNKEIGVIKDIAFSPTGVKAYIVDVGGFLGIGGHYVAVRPSAIKLTHKASTDKWDARMEASADQLKAAPEYKYPGS